jgi:hypothetical protein
LANCFTSSSGLRIANQGVWNGHFVSRCQTPLVASLRRPRPRKSTPKVSGSDRSLSIESMRRLGPTRRRFLPALPVCTGAATPVQKFVFAKMLTAPSPRKNPEPSKGLVRENGPQAQCSSLEDAASIEQMVSWVTSWDESAIRRYECANRDTGFSLRQCSLAGLTCHECPVHVHESDLSGRSGPDVPTAGSHRLAPLAENGVRMAEPDVPIHLQAIAH